MILQMLRFEYHPERTIGVLLVDGRYFSYTLEDTARKVKIAGRTAIPEGEYPVRISMSARFKRKMLEVQNVPGFSGIRIHSGNTEHDTEGCPLLGYNRNSSTIFVSRVAVADLEKKVRDSLDKGEPVTLLVQSRRIEIP